MGGGEGSSEQGKKRLGGTIDKVACRRIGLIGRSLSGDVTEKLQFSEAL